MCPDDFVSTVASLSAAAEKKDEDSGDDDDDWCVSGVGWLIRTGRYPTDFRLFDVMI